MPLSPGEPAPWFTAPTASNPEFVFDSAAGRYVLLLFLPAGIEERGQALKALAAHQALFDDVKASAFVVVPDKAVAAGLKDLRGLRWFLDFDGAVRARFAPDTPPWMLLDPALRVMGTAGVELSEGVFATLRRLPPPEGHAATALHAPVLIAPRILEPEMCAALIDLHQSDGGRFTGVMRDVGGATVHVMDEQKKRRDVLIADPDLQRALRERLERRLFPLVHLALGFTVSGIERYVVSCYDAADGGVFRPHRDNTTQGTAHRRFACSINLNEDFDGGDLRFPEYGLGVYRPPPGGAVVFSCALLHEALPVTRGRRYAFLPFFFDAAGARSRAEQPAQAAG